jgi:hypothetical protein
MGINDLFPVGDWRGFCVALTDTKAKTMPKGFSDECPSTWDKCGI